jgi:DNA mismatch endonuclease, patch repair protein
MDRISAERRSWNMSRIKSENTSPEKSVHSALHRIGLRFRLHQRKLKGRPDIVLPRYHTVIFVHGCFWHRHPGCRFAYTPKTRVAFWQKKFDDNVARDRHTCRDLRKSGWRVLVIWECQTTKAADLETLISHMLSRSKVCKPSRRQDHKELSLHAGPSAVL